jgi:hypothetical protein
VQRAVKVIIDVVVQVDIKKRKKVDTPTLLDNKCVRIQ